MRVAVIIILSLLILGCTPEEINEEKYCEKDSDCIRHCPKGCINKKYNTPLEEQALCKWQAGHCECMRNECVTVLD